jgi:uncharacterized protein (UPF0332 family)
VTAVLAGRGMEFTKHIAVRAALHRDLIQTGLLPADLGRDYDFLLDLRETADYCGVAEASLASATKAIEKARAILAALSIASTSRSLAKTSSGWCFFGRRVIESLLARRAVDLHIAWIRISKAGQR